MLLFPIRLLSSNDSSWLSVTSALLRARRFLKTNRGWFYTILFSPLASSMAVKVTLFCLKTRFLVKSLALGSLLEQDLVQSCSSVSQVVLLC